MNRFFAPMAVVYGLAFLVCTLRLHFPADRPLYTVAVAILFGATMIAQAIASLKDKP